MKVIFREFSGPSWTLSMEKAAGLCPEWPAALSYSNVAAAAGTDFVLTAETGELTDDCLVGADVVVLAHPSDTRIYSRARCIEPALGVDEVDAVADFVHGGGGLLLAGEPSVDPLSKALNALCALAGVSFNGSTIVSPACTNGHSRTIVPLTFGDDRRRHPIARGLSQVCFSGGTTLEIAPDDDRQAWTLLWTGADLLPARRCAAIALEYGKGRIVCFGDSDLFGDDLSRAGDHRALWSNTLHWLAGAKVAAHRCRISMSTGRSATGRIAADVSALSAMQGPDGAKRSDVGMDAVAGQVEAVCGTLDALRPEFPHQQEYFAALPRELRRWLAEGAGPPRFAEATAALRLDRVHGRRHFVLFPMSIMHGLPEVRFDCFTAEVFWPEWLAVLERTRYRNASFITALLQDPSDGYVSPASVFFPETIATAVAPTLPGVIFCNREAMRYQQVIAAVARATCLQAPPPAEWLLQSSTAVLDAFALCDLIHDTAHNRGPMPRQQFKDGKRQPYWMYALEELRADLAVLLEGDRLFRETNDLRGLQTAWAVLMDRCFRFSIAVSRVRNYDALAGQLLLAALFDTGALEWIDSTLTVQWPRVVDTVGRLFTRINGFDAAMLHKPRRVSWRAGYELVAEYVEPNEASTFIGQPVADCRYERERGNYRGVLDDEFPLGLFLSWLQRELGEVAKL